VASPRISVVVPFFNVADLLGECLQSIAAQTYRELEVIMVDDGSTDGSTEIASAQASADPRFILHRVENGGSPGLARNRGIERATGELLAFVDGDDVLPPGAYEVLLHTLERSGSDFVCGNVNRIGPWGVRQSGLHARAIKGRRIGTHIRKTPQLLYDISVFNKLFRKQFWDAHQLSFPEGMLWEDLQLMTQAHVLAHAVDVIPDHVYYWRERGLGELSITQSRTDIQNLRDRIDALLAIDTFLAERAPASLLRRHQRKALTNDLWLYVGDLHKVGDDYRAEFLDLAGRYLNQVSPRVLARLPSTQKLAYHLIQRRKMTELMGLLTWQLEQPVRTVPLVRSRGLLLADLPLRGDRQLRIPAKIFRPYWRELDPLVRVQDIGWRDDRLVIEGRAYIPSVDITKRRHTSKIVVLRPRNRRRPPIVLPTRSFVSPEATEHSGQERYNYEWAGFRCEISPRLFRLGRRWMTGEWECFMLVRSRGVWRPARIHTPMLGGAERPGFRDVAPGLRFRARWERRNLIVELVSVAAVLAGSTITARADDRQGSADQIQLDIDLLGSAGAGAMVAGEAPAGVDGGSGETRLVLARQGGAATLTFPVSRTGGDTPLLHADIEIDALLAGAESSDAAAGPASAVSWDVYISLPWRGKLRVAVADEGNSPVSQRLLAMPSGGRSAREVAVGQTRYGDLVISDRVPRPVITDHAWTSDGLLRLQGGYIGPPDGLAGFVLHRNGSGERYVVPCRLEGERFTVDVDVSRMPLFGRELPLRDGRWHILFAVPGTGGAGEELVPVGYEQNRIAAVRDEPVEFGGKQYRFLVQGEDTPALAVATSRRALERGKFNQRVLRNTYYPVKLHAPLRDAVMFVSWKGKQCTDNPLGIAAELRNRSDDREHIWAVTDPAVPVPDGATTVLVGSKEYYEALARSRYLIANDDMPAHYRKRDGQVYLQTWHGTPLKRIGFDVERPQFVSGAAYLDHLADDVANWDLLLSQNPFSTPILRRAFRFEGEICEYGYPRNDIVSRPGTAQLAATVRDRLGLPEGKRVVLYAPTWRDNQFYAAGRYRFDLRLDVERAWKMLGDDFVILIRGHHHMADDVPDSASSGFAINVTRYPDISELFLVSDILVTDYSSVMFDYASTGRPMLFFAYDLENYRDQLRGFYFDFEREAPGPLLATSDEVISAIGDIDTLATQHAAAYQAFTAKFCPLDDGKAGARVCDRLFGS